MLRPESRGARPRALPAFATVLAAALAAAPVGAQAPPPAGPEFPINVTVAGDQIGADVAREADGGFVVAWRSGGNSVVARRLDPWGAPRSGEIVVHTSPTLPAAAVPTVAAHPAGGFLVVWHTASGVFARRFDASGNPAGPEFALAPNTGPANTYPRVSAAAFGYVATWSRETSPTTVVARVFDAGGAPVSPEISIGAGYSFDVAAGPGFVVAWSVGEASIAVRRFDATGAPLGPVTIANGPDPTPNLIFSRVTPSVAIAADGSFTVAWHMSGLWAGSFQPMPLHTYDFGVYVRRFGAAGVPAGPEVQVNLYGPGWQTSPAVAMTPSSSTFVAWTSAPSGGCPPPLCVDETPGAPQDGSGAGVYARLFDANGVDVGGGEFRVNVATVGDQRKPAVAATDTTLLAVFEAADAAGVGLYARLFGQMLTPAALSADPTDEIYSDGNGVFENWEAVVVAPSWRNTTGSAQAVTSTASAFTGPPGAAYDVVIGTAVYGSMAPGATVSCQQGGQCFLLTLYANTRPAAHWDARFTETLAGAPAAPKTWTLHVGDSFADVPRASPYYRFVETVFHSDVMAGCGTGVFCPTDGISRQAMAVFVLKAANPGFVPPACVAGGELFLDVPAWNPYCPWVEELARRGVVAGCGGGNYCPTLAVSRETMAVYLLRTREGTAYMPPACIVPLFSDVPASSPFCRWIEELARRGVVGGCAPGFYCPTRPVPRDHMSVFLTGTFALMLYAP